jgi:hypothetical protein
VTTKDRQLAPTKPAGRGKEDSVGRSQLGANGLTPKHREFVAEHDDLELLELVRTKVQRGELNDATMHEVAG